MLKDELGSATSLCRVSSEFARYVVKSFPSTLDPVEAIKFADMLYFHATNVSASPIIPESLKGLSGAHATQAIYDFELHVRIVALKDPMFRESYNNYRTQMKLSPEFDRIFPKNYETPTIKENMPKSDTNSKAA